MDLKEKVIQLISEKTQIDSSSITESSNFIEDLNLDSLDMVELMMNLEDNFGIEIPEDETENLKTIGDVVKYLEANKPA